jgi:hypothetical protein
MLIIIFSENGFMKASSSESLFTELFEFLEMSILVTHHGFERSSALELSFSPHGHADGQVTL